jgi:hypothetical protein
VQLYIYLSSVLASHVTGHFLRFGLETHDKYFLTKVPKRLLVHCYLAAQICSLPRRTWEDNIKMDLREVGWGGGGMDWINLAQDRDRWRAVVFTMMNIRVP